MKVVMAADPGSQGALCILINNEAVVYDTPIKIVEKKTKSKKARSKTRKMRYHDPKGTYDLLKPFAGQDVLFGVEKVSARPGEGVVSVFNFAQSYAFWKMAAVCFGFNLVEFTPATWKKAYPVLAADDDLKDQVKALRAKKKVQKDEDSRQEISKEISSINRKIKARSKDAARELASELYPSIADHLKLKKHDGRAEAILMARYLRDMGDQ